MILEAEARAADSYHDGPDVVIRVALFHLARQIGRWRDRQGLSGEDGAGLATNAMAGGVLPLEIGLYVSPC